MIWKKVFGHPNYEISDTGLVRKVEGVCKGIKKQTPNSSGYLTVFMEGKQKYVHVLLLESFICPRPDDKFCDHIDRNKSNNVLSNLRWVTKGENLKNSNYTTKRIRSKFSLKESNEIKNLHKESDLNIVQIAKKYKCDYSVIHSIIHNTYKHNLTRP